MVDNKKYFCYRKNSFSKKNNWKWEGYVIFKKWLWLFRTGAVAALLAVAWRDNGLAMGMLWTYWQSTTAIGYWLHRGYPPLLATLIGTALGDFASFNWWAFAYYDLRANATLNRLAGAFWDIYPRETGSANWRLRKRGFAVFAVSCIPDGGAVGGLILANFLQLDQWQTLWIILLSNTLKNCFAGGLFMVANQNQFLKQHLLALAVLLMIVTTAIVSAPLIKKVRVWLEKPEIEGELPLIGEPGCED